MAKKEPKKVMLYSIDRDRDRNLCIREREATEHASTYRIEPYYVSGGGYAVIYKHSLLGGLERYYLTPKDAVNGWVKKRQYDLADLQRRTDAAEARLDEALKFKEKFDATHGNE